MPVTSSARRWKNSKQSVISFAFDSTVKKVIGLPFGFAPFWRTIHAFPGRICPSSRGSSIVTSTMDCGRAEKPMFITMARPAELQIFCNAAMSCNGPRPQKEPGRL